MSTGSISRPSWAGSSTLEVRWILPGSLDTAMVRWFGRFSARTERRDDIYLVRPQLQGLSVKIRGGASLEVKVHHGDAGTLHLPGRAMGGMAHWQKWTFPLASRSQVAPMSAEWTRVGKTRRVSTASASELPPLAGHRDDGGCTVELTEIALAGHAWWTLGFEANGPLDDLPDKIDATARLVFSEPLPGGLELRAVDSLSYAEWLAGMAARAQDDSGEVPLGG
jgi:hypothetical protein